MFSFEKLDVWHKALTFSQEIYQESAKFPSDERFGLTNQMRRSSVSIAANIAEGSSRSSSKEFARFIEVAYGSLIETVSHLRIAQNLDYISETAHDRLYRDAEELARMLSGLKARLLDQRE